MGSTYPSHDLNCLGLAEGSSVLLCLLEQEERVHDFKTLDRNVLVEYSHFIGTVWPRLSL